MTVAKIKELPVNEKERIYDEVNNLPQAIHDEAAMAGAIAMQTVYAKHCDNFNKYLCDLFDKGETFIPQGEEWKKWLLTGTFGFTATITATKQMLSNQLQKKHIDEFFYQAAMKKLDNIVHLVNSQKKNS